ncbi:TetR/AcrR family transcriptional regulator [Ruegeria sp. HKCCD8929]|uniref:TetR/AcrR family transcriptional regulator n=1 Tax=Ruegeria sp. HKCCD8929 TaxID=2683006 RepID=UPI00148A0C0D|nr:TetR/AcrR family transcriptional regulator [Ruegeria sp. HKCCD8929]
MEKQRRRAPSQRSLQTRARILDAAEILFAERGFEGASIRDIAARAGVQVGLVHHHGGGKEELFHRTVARRADELSRIRIEGLEALKARGAVTLHGVIDCFIRPYVTLAQTGGPGWLAYGRLVAHVSADPRWRWIAAECFDPTARRFIEEVAVLYPEVDPQLIATGQVYSVSAMLAFLNTGWRIEALSPGADEARLEQLIDFCVAGVEAMLAQSSA